MIRAAAPALLSLLLLACSSPDPAAPDGGVEDAGPVDGGVIDDAGAIEDAGPCALASPFSSSNPECNACAEAQCCAAINGCLLDPACNDDYVNCTLACALDADGGVDPCLADCDAQYPAGKAEYDMAFGCADTKCAIECQ